jgi:1-acyl-sn-glycerol-3-phosphate acyltransferase
LSEKPSPAPEAPRFSRYTPQRPGRFRRAFLHNAIRFFVGCYLRVRHENLDTLPEPPYLLMFSHPNWVDPFLLASHWPDPRRLFIFGPKEEDMNVGWRNALIRWSQMAVPFRPSKTDLLDTTRRATAVLNAGYVLALAGEGRLSDREGAIVPLQDGAAFFALRARVPVVPLAIIGTRWLRFGKTITMRAGPVVTTDGRRADREGVAALTEELQSALEALLVGVKDEPPPGWFGRWLTDVFNERPWLNEPPDGDDPARAR